MLLRTGAVQWSRKVRCCSGRPTNEVNGWTMGLDTTHGAWNGPYSFFNEFRQAVCDEIGLGSMDDYRRFGGDKPWPPVSTEPLVALLDHSDCDGELTPAECAGIARRLREIAPKLGDWEWEANRFAAGCESAAELKETLEFQ